MGISLLLGFFFFFFSFSCFVELYIPNSAWCTEEKNNQNSIQFTEMKYNTGRPMRMHDQHFAILHHRSSRAGDQYRCGARQDLCDCFLGLDDWWEGVEWRRAIRDCACDWGDCHVSDLPSPRPLPFLAAAGWIWLRRLEMDGERMDEMRVMMGGLEMDANEK